MYPEEIVTPMKKELTDFGFQDLNSVEKITEFISKNGTSLLVINSVCGCSAGSARPGVKLSLNNNKKPDYLGTVFAGFDINATSYARTLLMPFPPSSPCIAIFKDGNLMHMIERHHIEGNSAESIAENLTSAFNEFC